MRAVVAWIPEPGRVELVPQPVREPGKGELLLKALYSSMSPGTESALMAGTILPLPQKLGYSMVAEVIRVGPGVQTVRPGERVVVTAEHASLLVVDEKLATPVPDGADLEQAAFFNLAHTALYAVRQSGLQLGESCLVMGQGLVGALTACFARAAGAVPVVVSDVVDGRLAVARAMGITHTVNPQSNPAGLRDLLHQLKMDGFPVIFEATGRREPLAQALEHVGERGRVVMMSQGRDALPPEALQHLMMKGARLIGGYINSKPFNLYRSDLVIMDHWPPVVTADLQRHGGSGCWTSDDDIRVFLRFLQYRDLDLTPLISHRFHYSEIPQAYDLVWHKSPELMGGIIAWQE